MLAPLPASATMPPREGALPDVVSQAVSNGVLRLPSPPDGLPTSAAQPVWRIPVVMVGFSDQPLTYTPADFEVALFDTTGATPTGSFSEYYRWASGGRILATGHVVAAVQLPNPRSYYGYNAWGLNRISTPNNDYGCLRDALLACYQGVNWAPYDQNGDGFVDMVWLLHSGVGGEAGVDRNDLWSITTATQGYWNNAGPFDTGQLVPGSTSQHIQIDRFSVVPELSAIHPGARCEIGVFCHEFGHALGLPDLYDTSALGGATNSGPGNWSLMSTGAWGGDGFSPEYPVDLGAWPLLYLGWTSAIRPTEDSTFVLPPVERDRQVVELWFQGESNPEHFLIENRHRESFDRNLPNDGLIVYHLDEAVIGQRLQANAVNVGQTPGLRLVEADGQDDLFQGVNHGDSEDTFPGSLGRAFLYGSSTEPSTRAFNLALTNTALLDIAQAGDDVSFRAQVRAAGWEPVSSIGGSGYDPLTTFGTARFAGTDDAGNLSVVESEWRSGHPQVMLRTRIGGQWLPAWQVSQSSGNASTPTLAVLGNGDLVVVWVDDRDGFSALYYRARVRGVWTAEQRLSALPGNSRSPAIAADRFGNVHLAWIQYDQGSDHVEVMRFPYLSPFGQPTVVSAPVSYPGSPAIAARPDGGSIVLWSENATSPASVLFARFHPDSAFKGALPLTPGPTANHPELSVSGVVDAAGTLYAVWQVSGPGINEIRFQRRPATLDAPSPRDTVIESYGGPVQNPTIRLDPQGGLHIAYAAANSPSDPLQARYKRWHPTLGWDIRGTSVTRAADGNVVRVAAVPESPGKVTVLVNAFPQGEPELLERRRTTDLPTPLATPPAPPPRRALALSLGPNPLPPGRTLELRYSGPVGGATVVEVYDLAGRRVLEVPLEGTPGARAARVGPALTRAWPSGVYFARVRGTREAATRLVVLR